MSPASITSTGAAQAAPGAIWLDQGARYGWRIDVDHIADVNGDDTGTHGPRNISPASYHKLAQGEGTPFRMYDDDGTLYYSGRFIGNSEGVHAFAPLDDFGTPNAGATRIDYKRGRTWETL